MLSRKLGKKPKKFDHRTLQFARYLRKLPIPPVAIDRASLLPKNIGMMLNDKYGNCTMAAAGHMVQSWSMYAERGINTIPDSEILSAYLTISPNDDGATMLDALSHWRHKGVGLDKIEAYVEIAPADLTQAKLAIQYFGSIYIGMSLPDKNTNGPWINTTTVPNRNNGHAVCILAYDDTKKLFKVATWGEIVDMSYAWYQKYTDESYAVLNDISILESTKKSPSGFDYAQLLEDLNHLGDPVTEITSTSIPVPAPRPVYPPLSIPNMANMPEDLPPIIPKPAPYPPAYPIILPKPATIL